MRRYAAAASLLLTALLAACGGEDASAPSNPTPVCTPDARECLDTFNARICRPDGSGFDYLACTPDAPCQRGLCQPVAANSAPNNSAPNNSTINNSQNNLNNSQNNAANNSVTPGRCAPFERVCVSEGLFERCHADGEGADQGTCPADNPCREGYCGGPPEGTPNACVSGTRLCIDNTTVRVCRASGTGYDNVPCPAGEVCDPSDPTGATCRALTRCQDNDGDGYGEGADCLGLDCDDTSYNINPSGLEACGDGVDQDCDGADAPCACDPLAQDCPGARLKCSLNAASTFECRPDGSLGEGSPCGGIPDACERGTLCVGTGGGGQTCTRLCDPQGGQGCLGGAVCGATLNGQDGIGLCVGFTRCDPVDSPEGCDADQRCLPYTQTSAGCFDGGGALGEGAPCDPSADACNDGLICITTQDQGSACRPWCKLSRGNTDCDRWSGDTCAAITYTFTFLGREETITAFGVCQP